MIKTRRNQTSSFYICRDKQKTSYDLCGETRLKTIKSRQQRQLPDIVHSPLSGTRGDSPPALPGPGHPDKSLAQDPGPMSLSPIKPHGRGSVRYLRGQGTPDSETKWASARPKHPRTQDVPTGGCSCKQ